VQELAQRLRRNEVPDREELFELGVASQDSLVAVPALRMKFQLDRVQARADVAAGHAEKITLAAATYRRAAAAERDAEADRNARRDEGETLQGRLAGMKNSEEYKAQGRIEDKRREVASRAADMARRGYLRVAGVVENMSDFTCEHGTTYALFGSGGGERLAHGLGVPLIGSIPLHPDVAAGGDRARSHIAVRLPVLAGRGAGRGFVFVHERHAVRLRPKSRWGRRSGASWRGAGYAECQKARVAAASVP